MKIDHFSDFFCQKGFIYTPFEALRNPNPPLSKHPWVNSLAIQRIISKVFQFACEICQMYIGFSPDEHGGTLGRVEVLVTKWWAFGCVGRFVNG